jgi:hypothetical protein
MENNKHEYVGALLKGHSGWFGIIYDGHEETLFVYWFHPMGNAYTNMYHSKSLLNSVKVISYA